MKPPIFIIGNPRSGTTLLRLMLTCHKNIVIPPECGFLVWLAEHHADWAWDEKRLVERFIPDLFACRKIETWEFNRGELVGYMMRHQPQTYAALVSCVYEFYGINRGRSFTRWGDKNTWYIQHIPEIRAIFPRAVFIHIVRDGRDIACSYRDIASRKLVGPYAPKFPTDIEDIATEWVANLRLAGLAKKQGPILEVRYEDLVRETRQELLALCRRLDEEFDPQMLYYYQFNLREILEPASFLPWKEKTIEPLTASPIGRYKHQLSLEDQEAFVAIAGAALRNYGYLGG